MAVHARWSGFVVVRIALAAVLLAAATLKARQLATEPIIESSILASRWFLLGLVECELLLGLWLLFGAFPRLAWALAFACFCVFAVASLYKIFLGDTSCGCFGNASLSPWFSLMIDVAAVVALISFPPRTSQSLGEGRGEGAAAPRLVRPILTAALFLSLGLPGALAITAFHSVGVDESGIITEGDGIVVLEPVTWPGKRFPLFNYIDIGDELSRGSWIVLFVRSDCDTCHQILEELSAESRAAQHNNVAIIFVDAPARNSPTDILSENGCRVGRLDPKREWFIQTPTQAILDNALCIGAMHIEHWQISTRVPHLSYLAEIR